MVFVFIFSENRPSHKKVRILKTLTRLFKAILDFKITHKTSLKIFQCDIFSFIYLVFLLNFTEIDQVTKIKKLENNLYGFLNDFSVRHKFP